MMEKAGRRSYILSLFSCFHVTKASRPALCQTLHCSGYPVRVAEDADQAAQQVALAALGGYVERDLREIIRIPVIYFRT
jgi:hypothetical protein